MSCNFCVRDNCLISYSFFIAICFVSYVSTNTTSKGPRPRVYLAPLPSRCFVRRCFKLLVYPVYSVLSLHFKIYTTCSKLPIDNVLCLFCIRPIILIYIYCCILIYTLYSVSQSYIYYLIYLLSY